MLGDGFVCCLSWNLLWNNRAAVTPIGPTLCLPFHDLFQSHSSNKTNKPMNIGSSLQVPVLHTRLLCMNVIECSESMQNRIINDVFHWFFLPLALQGRECNGKACFTKQGVWWEDQIVCAEKIWMFCAKICSHHMIMQDLTPAAGGVFINPQTR